MHICVSVFGCLSWLSSFTCACRCAYVHVYRPTSISNLTIPNCTDTRVYTMFAHIANIQMDGWMNGWTNGAYSAKSFGLCMPTRTNWSRGRKSIWQLKPIIIDDNVMLYCDNGHACSALRSRWTQPLRWFSPPVISPGDSPWLMLRVVRIL